MENYPANKALKKESMEDKKCHYMKLSRKPICVLYVAKIDEIFNSYSV